MFSHTDEYVSRIVVPLAVNSPSPRTTDEIALAALVPKVDFSKCTQGLSETVRLTLPLKPASGSAAERRNIAGAVAQRASTDLNRGMAKMTVVCGGFCLSDSLEWGFFDGNFHNEYQVYASRHQRN